MPAPVPAPAQLELEALPGVPMVAPGDDLAALLLAAMEAAGWVPAAGDVLVIAQKVVSKAEGRQVPLADVTPSAEAIDLAAAVDKDPRLVELVLRESTAVVRQRPGVLIVAHRLGHVLANAGIDQSNIDHDGGEAALLLPEDPDASAAALRLAIHAATGVQVGVVINDSFGRPWRMGTLGLAIGSAGITTFDDRRGGTDLYGRELQVTATGRADEIAAAASLLMGQTTEATPVVRIRGLPAEDSAQTVRELIRPIDEDLFR